MASEIAEGGSFPVFTQELVPITPGLDIQTVQESDEQPPSTLCIAHQAVLWAEQRGLHYLYVVAADVHVWRCVRDIQWVSFRRWSQIRSESCSVSVSWQKSSSQKRVQSPWRWYPRECVLRVLPMWLYERITNSE